MISRGLGWKRQLENCTVGQVLEKAAELEKQAEERSDSAPEGIDAQIGQRVRSRVEMVEFPLKREIADLKAQLQTTAKAAVTTEPTITTAVAQDSVAAELTEEVSNSSAPQSSEEVMVESATISNAQDDELSGQVQAASSSVTQDERQEERSQPGEEMAAPSIEPEAEQSQAIESPSTITVSQPAVVQESVQSVSQPEEAANAPTTEHQSITVNWEQLKQLRAAESYLQEVNSHIEKFTSDLRAPRLDRIVEIQLRDVLKNRQNLRSTKIAQIVNLADNNGIPASYEALRNSGRVVLAPEYASALLRQAKSWSDVAVVVGRDKEQFVRAIADWDLSEQQFLVELLSSHLEAEEKPFASVDWIPKYLLEEALSSFTFTLQKIKKSDNCIDEPEFEYLRSCKLVRASNIGNRHEQWVFEYNGKNIPVAGRDEFVIEKF